MTRDSGPSCSSSGLASSDEGGRTDPNVRRYFDAPYMSWTAQAGSPDDRVNDGPLYTDRPHVTKVQATYDFNWGTSLGLNALFQSGVPVGALVSWQGYPVFIQTRDNLGRTPFQQRYDLFAQQEVRFSRTTRLLFSVNIDNMFDLKTVTDYNQTINRNSLRLGDDVYFSPNGFDPWALMNQVRSQGTSMDPGVEHDISSREHFAPLIGGRLAAPGAEEERGAGGLRSYTYMCTFGP